VGDITPADSIDKEDKHHKEKVNNVKIHSWVDKVVWSLEISEGLENRLLKQLIGGDIVKQLIGGDIDQYPV
jgi:hypothetical protein